MGETDILKITDMDVMVQLNGLQELGLPMVAPGYAMESVVMSYGHRAEAVVLSNLPEIYRSMTREVRGEVVVEAAYDGQETFKLGMYPVLDGTVDLYVDYNMPTNDRIGRGSQLHVVNEVVSTDDFGGGGGMGHTPYTFRSVYDRLGRDRYTVDNATGQVTLNFALRAGQHVYADYKHDGMLRCHNLRDIAIRLAASNFGSSLPGMTDSARNFLMTMEQTAMEQLFALQRGEAGVDMLDQLRLVDETRQPYRTPRRGLQLYM